MSEIASGDAPAMWPEIEERRAPAVNGGVGLLAILAVVTVVAATAARDSQTDSQLTAATGVLLVLGAVLIILISSGFVVLAPREARVVQFFGRYQGTIHRTGLILTLPLTTKHKVSVRVNNFETRTLKVNDADGNPVELGAVVVWQVHDTALATFAVADHTEFVRVQAEAAVRHVAVSHPYDNPGGTGTSLRGSTEKVAEELAAEVAARVGIAGVDIREVRISHLAYAPEIAQAMLQRQQAAAIVAARERIVDGAVGMVEMALARLQEHDIVELDEERKAAMVSNLLVVLCGDSQATPVVNTGTLYQ
jgi:regulator of protease activity HflC (stomatin/prohibitin superfamily)